MPSAACLTRVASRARRMSLTGGMPMPELPIRTRAGEKTALSTAELTRCAAMLRGDLVPKGAAHYEEARRIWNGMIDRRPALIARCRSAADVLHSVRFAREYDLLFSLRGGGHNIAGNALVQ